MSPAVSRGFRFAVGGMALGLGAILLWLAHGDPWPSVVALALTAISLATSLGGELETRALGPRNASGPAKADEAPPADDTSAKRKPSKAAKAKADDMPAPEVTQDTAVAGTQNAVRKCYAKDTAKARDFTHIAVDVTVDNTGLIKRATLRKKFGAGALAACVEKAVLQAEMPTGQGGERTLEYDLPVPEEP